MMSSKEIITSLKPEITQLLPFNPCFSKLKTTEGSEQTQVYRKLIKMSDKYRNKSMDDSCNFRWQVYYF